MFQQGKRIQNLNEDHQGTRLLLDNHLLRSEHRNLDVDGHIRIINSRIDRRRRDVASLEQRLDDLEAANILLTAKVAAMEPRLCRCGREEQPIVVEDGEREESSPSSYQTPPVASPDENQEPIPVRIATVREGQLVPVVEQEEIDELFRAIDREREAAVVVHLVKEIVIIAQNLCCGTSDNFLGGVFTWLTGSTLFAGGKPRLPYQVCKFRTTGVGSSA